MTFLVKTSRDIFRNNRQILLTMKLIAGLLLIATLQVSATGWTQKVTIIKRDISLKKVLASISRQTGVSVMFDDALIRNAAPVTINVRDATLEDALKASFTGTDLTYLIVNNTIVIRQQEKIPKTEPDEHPQKFIPLILITGTITDAKANPLQGVSVVIKGTTKGTTTNQNGQFTLNTGPDDVIEFSLIGYKTYSVRVGSSRNLDIVMEPDASNMGEVVVIGYGSRVRGTVTGAVSSINAAQLADRPTGNTTDLLQGLAPGLNITRANSGRVASPGTGINIRGPISRSDPGVLIVVDGIPQIDNNADALDNINPNDIESIDILKDAQAAIYGARAAGGVILVTTKRGKNEKPLINVGANLTYQVPALSMKRVNILELVEMMNESFQNDGQMTNIYTPTLNYLKDNNITMDIVKRNDESHYVHFDNNFGFYLGDYDWMDILFDPSLMQNYNVSVSGRSEKTNYYSSIGIVDQPSMLSAGANSNRKYFARLKYDYNLAKWMKVNLNFSMENQRIKEPADYGTMEFFGGLIWPIFMPYNDKGHYYSVLHPNPLGYATSSGTRQVDANRVRAQVGTTITPFKNFNIVADFAASYDMREGDSTFLSFDMYDENDNFLYSSTGGINSAGGSYGRSRYYVGNLYGNYHLDVDKHSIDLMAGTSHEEYDYRYFETYRRLGLITPQLPTMGVGSADQQFNSELKLQSAINSFFSRLNYTFDDKYIVEGTFRYDGSSKFAKGYQWKPFYGISAGWIITNEKFMHKASTVLDLLKLRASWGQVGNQASIGYFDFLPQINFTAPVAGGLGYPFGSALSPVQTLGAYIANLPSNDRTWETVETKNLGVDFGLLKSRLTGSLDVFVRDDANMFYTRDFPQVLGTFTPELAGLRSSLAPSVNGAHVRVKGFEASVEWKDKIGKFNYRVGIDYSNSTNKVLELADARIPRLGLNAGSPFVEGYPVATFFGYQFDGFITDDRDLTEYTSEITSGIPQSLKPGDAKYKDLDGDGRLVPQLYDPSVSGTSGDLMPLGDNTQHHMIGINLGASWKNFDFSMFLQGVLRWNVKETNYAFIYDSWPAMEYFYGNTWTPDNPGAKYPRLSSTYAIRDNNYVYSDAPYIFINNRYLRLKNLQLGYNLPKNLIQRINLQNLRVYFTGFDVFEFDNLPGTRNGDPEKPFNPYITPMMRRYSLGVNVTL